MTKNYAGNAESIKIYRLMLRLAVLAVGLAVVVIMLGAWTRLVHAGLGCPDWPGCYGFLTVPQGESSIAIANARFPETPVDVAKGWPEMIHRYAAGTLGILVFTLAAYAVRQRKLNVPVKLPLFIAGFIVLQGAFGMWTVTLKLWPQVVALHLLGGFTTLSLLALLVLRLRSRVRGGSAQTAVLKSARSGSRLRPWLYGGLLLVIMQIALGAWTAANYAAVACTDLPTCGGQWWPQGMDFAHGFDITQHVGPNYLGGQLNADGRVAIHVSHRLGAAVVLVYFSVLLALLWARRRRNGLGQSVAVVAVVLLAQIALGLANVILYIPLAVAVAHNATGALLLLSVIQLIWHQRQLSQGLPAPLSGVKGNKNNLMNSGKHQEITA
ncbi:COX15/CtaA family protein [Marinobacter sp. M3C]|uniref:COX15/CtaA family protein n=1 Tax=unclassified Marinobacter TaxID=83889 RepID=UPI00200BD603|nr:MULTISPECIES: COX15/CtaA family protein [unclassified Marinobacter]MCL1476602.1 COX15/CtaA family protein [Marinobacter sp.]MCL1481210.1 COX15/CtaA family protein [Marinobacter sp.]MCL1484684.1 COX15/CtaA family protein [Marinobacter sp.]MCL1487925.1 COX15/CtaA family protein [Marinobacter sp.]UQG58303.1 COX15/CtaA family protein [Marinobacter sp. M4C]